MAQVKFRYGTKAQFDALTTKDTDTLYFITDKGVFYKGSTPFAVAYSNLSTEDSGTGEKSATTVTLTDQLGNTVTFSYPNSAALSAIKTELQNSINDHKAVKATASASGHVTLSDDTDSDSGASASVAATPKAVKDALAAAKEYASGILSANDAMVFKGTIGTSGTVTALPTTGYSAGWTYRVITAGTYAGVKCEVGDLIIAVKDFNTTTANSDWTVAQTNIDGAVTATTTLTSNGVILGNGNKTVKALANGAKGKVLKINDANTPAWEDERSYSFLDGEDGSFTVTPSDGDPQKVFIGKPGEAETADQVKYKLTVNLGSGTSMSTTEYNGSEGKTVSITPSAIGAAAASDLEWKSIGE